MGANEVPKNTYRTVYREYFSNTDENRIEITGTITNLTCVYEHRDELSLNRHVNPVPIFVKACSWNYLPNIQHHLPTPSPFAPVELIPVPFKIPPVNKWPLFTLAQLDLLGCHLKVWKQNIPTFEPNDIITIDLSQSCEANKVLEAFINDVQEGAFYTSVMDYSPGESNEPDF